jgi:hypothetical protein
LKGLLHGVPRDETIWELKGIPREQNPLLQPHDESIWKSKGIPREQHSLLQPHDEPIWDHESR